MWRRWHRGEHLRYVMALAPGRTARKRRRRERMLRPIDMNTCEAGGHGARRPEDVAVSADGEVWLSDQGGACAMIDGPGALVRRGDAGGAPKGINFDLEGRIAIANFGGPDDGHGPL